MFVTSDWEAIAIIRSQHQKKLGYVTGNNNKRYLSKTG